MPEKPAPTPNPAPTPTFRKGNLIKVNKEKFLRSLEAASSDQFTPEYVFEGPGELLAIKEDYAQIRWRRPVPDSWLRLDQLENFN